MHKKLILFLMASSFSFLIFTKTLQKNESFVEEPTLKIKGETFNRKKEKAIEIREELLNEINKSIRHKTLLSDLCIRDIRYMAEGNKKGISNFTATQLDEDYSALKALLIEERILQNKIQQECIRLQLK